MVLALQETFGMNDDDLVKAATAMSGGIGGMNDCCGALLGAAMMLGVVYGNGKEDIEDKIKMEEVRMQVGKMYKWFEREYQTPTCRDLRKIFGGGVFYDRHIPWQAELAEEADVDKKCGDMVEKTAAKTAEMIYDGMKPGQKKSEGEMAGGC